MAALEQRTESATAKEKISQWLVMAVFSQSPQVDFAL
jgi:hypothetical protein